MQRRKFVTVVSTVVSLVGLLIIGGILFSQFKSNAFVVYSNEELKFKIKHPKDWKIEEAKYGDSVILFISPKENDLDLFQENVNVVVQDLSINPLSFDEYTDIAMRQIQAVFKDAEILESSDFFIKNTRAHRFVYRGGDDTMMLKFSNNWLLNNDVAYQINYTAQDVDYDKYLPVMKKMLKSFRMLN